MDCRSVCRPFRLTVPQYATMSGFPQPPYDPGLSDFPSPVLTPGLLFEPSRHALGLNAGTHIHPLTYRFTQTLALIESLLGSESLDPFSGPRAPRGPSLHQGVTFLDMRLIRI